MNKHGVSRRWFTEVDVKHFKSGTLRTIRNIIRSMANWKKKKIHSQAYFKDFVRTQNSFLKCKCFHGYFQGFTDSELPTLKMDFFEVVFQKFCG